MVKMANSCNNCNYEIRRGWNYCPRCGFEQTKWYDKFSYGMDDLLKEMITDLQNMIFGNVIKMNFDIRSNVNPLPLRNQQSPKHQNINEDYVRDVKEVVDADANVVRGDFFTEVEMNVKGVESLDDVYITINERSAEIRAYTRDNKKMYFKVVEIPPYADVVEQVLKKDGRLILRFEPVEDELE